jgi:hypothetical protein
VQLQYTAIRCQPGFAIGAQVFRITCLLVVCVLLSPARALAVEPFRTDGHFSSSALIDPLHAKFISERSVPKGLNTKEIASVELAAPTAAELSVMTSRRADSRPQPQRLQVGIARNISGDALAKAKRQSISTQQINGQQIARLRVRSNTAAALRVGLRGANVPPGSIIRVRGASITDNEFVMTAYAADEVWTPVTSGEMQEIEIVLPRDTYTPSDTLLSDWVTQLSHWVVDFTAKDEQLSIGKAAGACNRNVACDAVVSQLAEASVARMSFVDTGKSFVCTGSLIADDDRDTERPFLITANHCFDNELYDANGRLVGVNKDEAGLQRVADTLATLWNYQTTLVSRNVRRRC